MTPSTEETAQNSPSLDETDKAEADTDAVDRARDSLEATLQGLKLTPEEEKVLADEIRQLRELTKKLDETTIEIAAFGMVSRGKSSVLNALLGRDVFEVGATHGTTTARIGPAVGARGQRTRGPRPGAADSGRHAGHRRGRRRGPRGPGPRGRPHRRPDPLHRLGRHAAQGGRGPLRAALASEADPPGLQPDRPLPRGRPPSRSTPSSRTSG